MFPPPGALGRAHSERAAQADLTRSLGGGQLDDGIVDTLVLLYCERAGGKFRLQDIPQHK